MDHCDVLIVGAGPAGSACAWALRRAGSDVVLLDEKRFPRNKVCAGWITPEVIEELEINPDEYAAGRVLQPITGFRVGPIGKAGSEIAYRRTVSHSIRRCEFDEYLARRSGARLVDGTALESLERCERHWIINGSIRTPVVVGAGGHFCPVARYLGAKSAHEVVVAAQEAEFEMEASQLAQCPVRGEIPELYFCPDLKGYGWCVRKKNFLNVGLGRLGENSLADHVSAFLKFLKDSGRVAFNLPCKLRGHAYLLSSARRQNLIHDGALLIGDAAGLAYSPSGEGIRPAIESGLLAARTIVEAADNYDCSNLATYPARLNALFDNGWNDWTTIIGQLIPKPLVQTMAGRLLASRWFARKIVLDRWFLHLGKPALSV